MKAFEFTTSLLEGGAEAALYCAHRTDMYAPSKLARFSLQGWGLIDLPLRASNERSPRPRVARAKKIIRLHPFPSSASKKGTWPLPSHSSHFPHHPPRESPDCPSLRASNEGLLEAARCASKKDGLAAPLLFFL